MKDVLFIMLMCFGFVVLPARAGYDEAASAFNSKDYATAYSEFRALADQGDAQGQNGLGVLYANGWGVPKDEHTAATWYSLAVNQGLAIAQYNLAGLYENGKGVPQNYQEALRLYRLSADQGFAMPTFSLGYMYETGRGVPEDIGEAIALYRKAADKGLDQAQKRLGYLYAAGKGVKQDPKEAVRWFRLAADQGDAEAQYRLRLYRLSAEQSYEPAQEALRKNQVSASAVPSDSNRWPISRIVSALQAAAERGDPAGQVHYGQLFESGTGVPKDYQQALYWTTKAAKQGYAKAQTSLGTTYYYGYMSQGIPKNRSEALTWFKKGAEGGHDHAQYMYGVMLADGDSVDKDMRKAVNWWGKAAAQGNRDATKRLQKLESDGGGSLLKGLPRENGIIGLQQRAQQGDPAAQHELGDRLYSGKGITQDTAAAIDWLRKALPSYLRQAEQGDAESQYEVGNMLWHINRGPTAESFVWYKKAASQGHVDAISALIEAPENGR